MSHFIMIAGPNGAGKSTYTRQNGIGDNIPVVDPDRIAAEEHVNPFKAGMLAVSQIRDFLASGQSFVRETTLSGKNELRFMKEAKEKGFTVSLVFVGIDSAKQSRERVSARQAQGGHGVAEEDILRRYDRCLANLPKAIILADDATLINNEGKGYEDVAEFEDGQLVSEQSKPRWYIRVQEIAREQRIDFGINAQRGDKGLTAELSDNFHALATAFWLAAENESAKAPVAKILGKYPELAGAVSARENIARDDYFRPDFGPDNRERLRLATGAICALIDNGQLRFDDDGTLQTIKSLSVERHRERERDIER